MFKKYGASRDHSYKFHCLVLEEKDKNKDNNDYDSDKLIEEEDNNDNK